MKKSIAILLVLVLATAGLFAVQAASNGNNNQYHGNGNGGGNGHNGNNPPVEEATKNSTINISSRVKDFSAFGVSNLEIKKDGFKSIAKFQDAVKASINTKVDMLDLHSFVQVGYLSGINNTAGDVNLSISIANLVSGDNSVAMEVSPTSEVISASKNSKFGTLENKIIKVKEAKRGTAALAPAGKYSTTVTISLVTVS